MAIKRTDDAMAALRQVLGPMPDRQNAAAPAPTIVDGGLAVAPLSEGLSAEQPQRWLWSEPVMVPTLRDPQAYRLSGGDGLTPDQLHAPIAACDTLTPAQFEEYCAASADVTMRGGTTSGVIYPLAICELGRRYRLRNVGGASAGAIAAAAAAAAELGRLRAETTGRQQPDPDQDELRQGHVRQGFPGLADTLAWIAQVDCADTEPDQFRLGRLFRPTRAGIPLFRLFVAAMRGRSWMLPILALFFLGPTARLLNLAVIVVTSCWLAWGWSGVRPAPVLWSAVSLAALTTALVLASLLYLGRRKAPGPAKGTLPEPVYRETAKPAPRDRLVWLALLAACAVVVWRTSIGMPIGDLLGAWSAELLAMAVILVALALRISKDAKHVGYGLISGASPPNRYQLVSRLSGLPSSRGERPLMIWLNDTLNELAGLEPGEVLRFGHLWDSSFVPGQPATPALRLACAGPGHRQVNLELMTTEVVQQRSVRWPLPECAKLNAELGGTLYMRKQDFDGLNNELLPPEVIKVLFPEGAAVDATCTETGESLRLYPLPEPWDLPVILAVRMSLAFPGLFQGVRMYRVATHLNVVRDDYGRVLRDCAGRRILYPNPDLGGTRWASELWFTDGGVTSNFPVQLFDSLLPCWPTFGINLGGHPPGNRHQDVWLPQDGDLGTVATSRLGPSFGNFFGAVFDTARGWSDNAQTCMPSFRGRIAWVRQAAGEGGNNLFMDKRVIAGLALRGHFAGVRLRRRYSAAGVTDRMRWLRFRTAVSSIDALRDDLAVRLRHPQFDVLTGPDGAKRMAELAQDFDVEDPKRPKHWFLPSDPGYWSHARGMLRGLLADNVIDLRDPLNADELPRPFPELRQTPR